MWLEPERTGATRGDFYIAIGQRGQVEVEVESQGGNGLSLVRGCAAARLGWHEVLLAYLSLKTDEVDSLDVCRREERGEIRAQNAGGRLKRRRAPQDDSTTVVSVQLSFRAESELQNS